MTANPETIQEWRKFAKGKGLATIHSEHEKESVLAANMSCKILSRPDPNRRYSARFSVLGPKDFSFVSIF